MEISWLEQLLSFAKQSAFQLNWHKNTSAWYYQLSFRNNWYFVVEVLQQLLSGFSQDINLDNCPSVSVNVAVKPSAYVSFDENSFHEAPREIKDTRQESSFSLKFINRTNWFATQHVRKTNSDLTFFVRWSLEKLDPLILFIDIFVVKIEIIPRRKKQQLRRL